MKLRYEFSVMEMDGEYMAVPVGDNAEQFNGMLRMNDVSAGILDLLKEDTTEQAVIAAADPVKSAVDQARFFLMRFDRHI